MQPEQLVSSISLRRQTPDDLPFLQTLYSSTREKELAITHFSLPEKQSFLRQQFQAQTTHYANHYDNEHFYIIERKGEPVGRFLVDYWTSEIRIIDISLLPQHCGHGIGSHFFKRLFEEAKSRQCPVTIHVEHNNRAKSLYERLGFQLKTKTNDIYLLMEWKP